MIRCPIQSGDFMGPVLTGDITITPILLLGDATG